MDDIQAIFFEECAEGLAAAESGLSAMQGGDVSSATIAAVFRAVHSIKGGAGAFGHVALTAFAHKFENLLDEVRAGRIEPSPNTVRVMLSALDILGDHVTAAQTKSALPDDQHSLDALQAILDGEQSGASTETGAGNSPLPTAAPAEQPVDYAEDPFGFEPVTANLDLDFDIDGDAAETGEAVDPDTPSIDASDAAPDAEEVWRVEFAPSRAAMASGGEPILVIRELEDFGGRVIAADYSKLPSLRDVDPEQAYMRWTIELPGWTEQSRIQDAFDFVAPDSHVSIERVTIDTPPANSNDAPETMRGDMALSSVSSDDNFARVAMQSAANGADAKSTSSTPNGSGTSDGGAQTIRVDLFKLDMLLNLVGELVIRNSILSDRLSAKDQERVELPELARLTREIQDNVMSLRAQPIKQAFSRVPRMLRDLMAETGKQVQLVTFGETTEVDKGVIEKIGDPLTHLIRNAVDHGLETTEERLRAGKSPEGTITLSAEQKGARIIVTVADDGRGIDRDRVRSKAIEKGIISADAVLSDEEIDQLICAPGFSTAATISNISGRGVGMDVVRANVEALGGRVEITSVAGKGTTFTLILPLTLAILDGMVVRLAGQRFVLPLATVSEAIRPEAGQVSATSPESEVIEIRGEYLPVRRLTQIFGLHANEDRALEDSLIIIVESEGAGRVGLLVDTIDDRREVVIKSLEQNLHPIKGLGGATILGDGSIALILDIEALVAPTGIQNRNHLRGLAA